MFRLLLIAFIFLFVLNVNGQHQKSFAVPFVLHGSDLTDYSKSKIETAFEAMAPSDVLRFTFIHKDERKKGEKYCYLLTQKRAEAVSAFLLSLSPAPEAIEIFVEPFDKPKNISEASNLSYKKFAGCNGICSVIAHKPGRQLLGTSVSAGNALLSKDGQQFFLLASQPNTIYAKEGTVIEFADNAFVYENGGVIKCDTICVFVWEFYSMADIIVAGLTTKSGKKMLVTAGMIYIEARCEGKKLKLKPNNRAFIKMPANTLDKKMKVFSGKQKNNLLDWTEQPNDIISTNTDIPGEYEGEDSLEEGNCFLMKVSNLGWINCDKFYNVKEKTRLMVKADTNTKTSVVLVFTKMKSALPGYYMIPNKIIEFSDLPLGEDVTVVAYRVDEKNKKAVAGTCHATLGNDVLITVQMKEMPLDDFKSILGKLD